MLIPTAIQQAPSTANFAYAALREEQPAGTDAGTFTSGAWRTRVLNTESFDPYSIVSLASNQFTLQAGTYWIEARAPAVAADHHIAKLRNITDSSDTLTGSTGLGNSGGNEITHSIVQGRFTITSAKTFELQHQCQTTKATVGLGSGFNMGVVEVYAEVELWKEVAVGAGAITNVEATIPADVPMASANTFYDGPSASFSAGTWLIVYKMHFIANSTNREFTCKLWDGSTIYDESDGNAVSNAFPLTVNGQAIVTLGSTTTLKVSAASSATTQTMTRDVDANSGGSHTATRMTGIRIA